MNSMKKIVALLLAAAMVFALAACGAARETEEEEEDTETTEELLRERHERTFAPPAILTQPQPASGAVGERVRLSVEAEGEALNYQWQFRQNSEKEWENCSGEGCTTAEYSTILKGYHEGYQFRCLVSNPAGEAVSEAAELHLVMSPLIIGQPGNATASVGDKISFSVQVAGNDLKYQWYYRVGTKGEWNACSGTGYNTDKYSLTVKDYHDGYQYRCEIVNDLGKVYTEVATLTLK